MCGIFGFIGDQENPQLVALSALAVRGPDSCGAVVLPEPKGKRHVCVAHTRLSVNGSTCDTVQPFTCSYGRYCMAVNGEIYNHKELCAKHDIPVHENDCAMLLPLIIKLGFEAAIALVQGPFAAILFDHKTRTFHFARDFPGICPLYVCVNARKTMCIIASDIKPMNVLGRQLDTMDYMIPNHVLPGLCYAYQCDTNKLTHTHNHARLPLEMPKASVSRDTCVKELREVLERNILKRWRMVSFQDKKCILLSGGLDSSIIAATVVRHERLRKSPCDVNTFSIGMHNSPDMEKARRLACSLGTIHHEISFSSKQGWDLISSGKMAHILGSFDVTTTRASTPMVVLAQEIHRRGFKVALSGEGADELFAGYLYNHFCPSETEMFRECNDKIEKLHMYDLLRANHSMMSASIECRVPFLDREVVQFALSRLPPAYKMIDDQHMEKQILRDAFRDMLPAWIVDRTKEQFSDGVGFSWIDHCRAKSLEWCTRFDAENESGGKASSESPELRYYRHIFKRVYGDEYTNLTQTENSVACSTARAVAWRDWKNIDASGRAVEECHTHHLQ